MTRLCIVSLLALTGVALIEAALWSYTGDTGPDKWHQLFPMACSGEQQSPIDIRTEETIYNPHLKEFAIWYDPPKPDSNMTIQNNGHTVQVKLEGEFYVTNAGLSNVYKALQFHFHWGHKEHHGSEHLMDGEASPIELHLVTYNNELYSISEALTSKGGLAVLGVMYEISEEDNPNLDVVVRALKYIRDPDNKDLDVVALPLVSLRDFLPKDLSRYFRYNGSLTTPGCFESVTWTVFEEKQTISRAQLREFTKVLQNKHRKGKHGGGRHRRSLSRRERKLERRAERVLEELGIKGDEDQEAEFKSLLIYQKLMDEMPQGDDPTAVETYDSGEERKDVFEISKEQDRPKTKTTTEQTSSREGGSKDSHQDSRDTAEEHKTSKAEHIHTDEETEEYIQEILVNNFRPVQPINDRIVYRSFKLRVPSKIVQEDYRQSSEYTVQRSGQTRDGGNGATGRRISLAAVALILLTILVF